MRISKAISRICWGGFLLGVAVVAAGPAMGQVSPYHRDQLAKGLDFFHRDDPFAHDTLLPLAEGGDPVAQHAVAFFYLRGYPHVPQDRPRAAALYKQSAAQAYAPGQIAYASMLADGYGAGVSPTLYPLFPGWFHAQALYWYRKAAEQDDRDAYYNLGRVYRDGTIVPPDLTRAYVWFTLAASRGSDMSLAFRKTVSDRMSAEQIAVGERWAQTWLLELDSAKGRNSGADETPPPAAPCEGEEAADNAFNDGDKEQGFAILLALAEAGCSSAQHRVAAFYHEGRIVGKDPEQAREWYKKSAKQGNPRGQLSYGRFLLRGGEKSWVQYIRDPEEQVWHREEGIRWILVSADQGYSPAMEALGHQYETGRHAPKDLVLAYKWYRLATDRGATHTETVIRSIVYRMPAEDVERAQALVRAWEPHNDGS